MDKNKLMPEVVYIAGYGRSGSTLLDLLLGNHPMIFGAGEVTDFPNAWANGWQCTCGQRYAECAFWQKVIEQLFAEFPDLNLMTAQRMVRKVESSLILRQSQPGNHPLDLKFYGQFWRTMMMAIGQASGRSIIVDSSKSSHGSMQRLEALIKIGGFKVKVIHLIRDPRAVAYSALRGSNKLLAAHQSHPRLRGGVYRALIGWAMTNLYVHFTIAANRPLEVMRLKYEDLVYDPVRELHRLGVFLNLDLGPVIDAVANQRAFDPGHGIAGNRMRHHGPVLIKPDEEWKHALPQSVKILTSSLLWPLTHKYGYDVVERPHYELLESKKIPL